jgi:hypothetical protein
MLPSRDRGAQIAGGNAGAGQAIGGYQRGASEACAGADQNYRLEVGANKQIYVSQVDAAGQIRDSRRFDGSKQDMRYTYSKQRLQASDRASLWIETPLDHTKNARRQ